MRYRYYLNNVLLVNEPAGWDSFIDKVERVEEIKGLFVAPDINLLFEGDGYAVLKALYDTSFCGEATLLIEESCDQVNYYTYHEGIIFISDCVFYPNLCYVEARVQDNSFYAKINNNKSIKVLLEVGISKNGVTYTGAEDYQVVIFDPCTTLNYARTPHTVRVYEALRCVVAFMTDDTMDFRSTLFDVGGTGEGDTITDGIHLSSTDAAEYSSLRNIEKVSFMDILMEMSKKYDMGMMIDISTPRPTLVIEEWSYFHNATSLMTLNNVSGVRSSIFVEKLYSQVRFGSETTRLVTGCPGLAFPVDQLFKTFKEENFHVLGTCNIDKTLDLYGQWIIDSNIIQDLVVNGTVDYDDRIVLLETLYSNPNLGQANQGNPFNYAAGVPPRFYNEKFLNSNVADRFFGAIPNSIAQALANIADECFILRNQVNTLSSSGTTPATYAPVVFNDKTTPPFHDPGGNFTLASGRYTAATGGLYKFKFTYTHRFEYIHNLSPFEVRIYFRQFDSGGNPVSNSIITTNYSPGDSFLIVGINTNLEADSKVFVMNTGDYIDVALEMFQVGVMSTLQWSAYIQTATFETTYTSNGGGDLAVYDPADYPVYKYEFEYPLSIAQMDAIKAQPNYAITFNTNGTDNLDVFIHNLKYNRKSGIGQFTCFKSLNQ